jgi:hypothetical protein
MQAGSLHSTKISFILGLAFGVASLPTYVLALIAIQFTGLTNYRNG